MRSNVKRARNTVNTVAFDLAAPAARITLSAALARSATPPVGGTRRGLALTAVGLR
ncbi:hypothetical protein GCM10027199_53570 [Amycolatopsis magusensis]